MQRIGSTHVTDITNEQIRKVAEAERNCTENYGINITNNDPFTDPSTKTLMCPPYFDTLACWPPQPTNSTSIIPCPSYLIGFLKDKSATRYCMEDGRWFTVNNVPYANYTECAAGTVTTIYKNMSSIASDHNISDQALNVATIISQIGYSISLISLLIAFTIMFKIKKLHCARNIIHMNLFASFILRAFMHILKESLFVEGLGLNKDLVVHNGTSYFHVDVMNENNHECKLIVSLVQYFTTANYSWILMEGIYLNNLILRALFTDSNRNLMYYIIFGWGLPFLVVIPWVIARILFEDNLCWTVNENVKIFMIILVPTFISVLINLILFVIISIVLYNKLRSPVNEDTKRYLRWAKSTLVLVPLFGVNYAFFIALYILNKNIIWMLCDHIFGSFQGFLVAILYCFLNGEVKSEVQPYMYTMLIFLATNDFTKYCFPCRKKFLNSAAGRQSVCTTMSCSSLYNNGINFHHRRNSRSKSDQLNNKIKGIHSSQENVKEFFLPRHSIPKTGNYAPNLTFVHNRYPMNMMTTNIDSELDTSAINKPHSSYSNNLPPCEEERTSMLEEIILSK